MVGRRAFAAGAVRVALVMGSIPGVDERQEFVPPKTGLLAELMSVTDGVEAIRARVRTWIDDPVIDVIITTGGTGFTGRDVTPEAVEPLFEKRMEGFSTLFLMVGYDKVR